MEFEDKCRQINDIDGHIETGKQFDLNIVLPEDNRGVIFGIVKDCYKEPVKDAVVKLIEVDCECGKEERKPVSHTFTDEEGEFVFGPLCPDKKYEIQIFVNRVKHVKVCAKCHREGKCLKGVDLKKCDCFVGKKDDFEKCKKNDYEKKYDYEEYKEKDDDKKDECKCKEHDYEKKNEHGKCKKDECKDKEYGYDKKDECKDKEYGYDKKDECKDKDYGYDKKDECKDKEHEYDKKDECKNKEHEYDKKDECKDKEYGYDKKDECEDKEHEYDKKDECKCREHCCQKRPNWGKCF